MSAPDKQAALELAEIRKARLQRKLCSMKARITEGVRLYEAATGKRVPEHLKPAELLTRINPHLREAGYLERELPKPRQVHHYRTGR